MSDKENGAEVFDESEEITDEDRVTLTDEDGQEHQFLMMAVVEVEDIEYALLTPDEGENADEDSPMELFIFIYEASETGDEVFSSIEDDETYDAVEKVFSSLIEMED